MNKLFSILPVLLVLSITSSAQDINRNLTLSEVITIAREQSTAALRAETIKENRYWQYRTFRADYVPQLALEGTLPDFNRSVTPVTQEDGSTAFRAVSINNSNLSLGISQTIALTGGRVFLSSEVNRFDDFDGNFTRYSGNPAQVGFFQPLFSFNQLKWDKRIEPLRYEESRREYVENLEEISQTAAALFFDLLLAQISLDIAQKNVNSNDTVYQIAQGRYDLGKIPENELLQLELNLMNSRQQVAQASLDLETSTLQLKSFLGFNDEEEIQLLIPEDLPQFTVNVEDALSHALKNRQEAVAFDRRRLEADRDVAQAAGETGLNANLFGQVGLTNSSNDFSGIYSNPEDQERVRLGFTIPILDWGRQKSRTKTAEANQKLVQYTVEQDRINFEQEVFTQVKQFEMLKDQVLITSQADNISQRRYNISKNRYLIGKISITDLSLALTEKDNAKRTYINSLRNFWNAYYNLRRLTLFDFQTNSVLYSQDAD